MNEFLLLFEDCRIVEGYKKVLIYDLNRPSNSNYIPKSLVPFINKCKIRPLKEVIEEIEKEDDQQIAKEYVDFIIDNEFGFLADEHVKEQIGKLTFDVEGPEFIYNSIVCINDHTINYIDKTLNQLDALLCINIEFRCELSNSSLFEKLIGSFEDSMIETVVIRINYSPYLDVKYLSEIVNYNSRIKELSVFGGGFNKDLGVLKYYKSSVDFVDNCGFIKKDNFMINQPFYTESQSCNTCLNKKISIDFNGSIKNCPSSKKDFGNIATVGLQTALANENFKSDWDINKDQIEVCKDCENRHMCLDCRMFTDDAQNKYSRPSRCTYNPYIAKWKGEEGYKTLNECGVFSDENGFTIDHKKIEEINQELWGE